MISGIQDTSNGGRYHNKRFKAEAEKRDLKVGYAPYIGYSVTAPTARFIEVIRENGLYLPIGNCRTGGSSIIAPPPSPTGSDDLGVAVVAQARRKQAPESMSVPIADSL